MENMQRARLLERLHGAKYLGRDEAVILCTLAAEEITRLDNDCRVLYGLLMRREGQACPCRDEISREVRS